MSNIPQVSDLDLVEWFNIRIDHYDTKIIIELESLQQIVNSETDDLLKKEKDAILDSYKKLAGSSKVITLPLRDIMKLTIENSGKDNFYIQPENVELVRKVLINHLEVKPVDASHITDTKPTKSYIPAILASATLALLAHLLVSVIKVNKEIAKENAALVEENKALKKENEQLKKAQSNISLESGAEASSRASQQNMFR